MPSNDHKDQRLYAILGATGQTGAALLKHLLKQSDVHLNLYARSATRLRSQNAQLDSNPAVTIYAGDLSDNHLLVSCLRSCSVIFSVLATNINAPGTCIAQRSAHSVVTALEQLRKESSDSQAWQCPTVIMLSSTSLNPKFASHAPFAAWVASKALHYIYSDLTAAIDYYRKDHPWIPMVQAQASGLVPNKPYDLEPTVQVSLDQVTEVISYNDLARGMVMIAEEYHVWKGKDVSIVLEKENPALPPRILWNLVGYILPGLLYTYFPWLYAMTHRP